MFLYGVTMIVVKGF